MNTRLYKIVHFTLPVISSTSEIWEHIYKKKRSMETGQIENYT